MMTGIYEDYTFVFDVDGTICPIKKQNEQYEDLIPYKNIVDKIRMYKKEGAKIIIFSSRSMRTFEGNLGKINKNTAPAIMDWLHKWGVPYDEIYFGKPWPGTNGFYIDDRSVRPDEFIANDINELDRLCTESRKRLSNE